MPSSSQQKEKMSSSGKKEKLRVLLIPFVATSHIQPFTELAIRLAAANDALEATVAVTPASVSIVESLVNQRRREQKYGGGGGVVVKIATYPFPRVDGISKGVEILGKGATPEESFRIQVAAGSESLTGPAQETLIRAQSPDAIVTDLLFGWNRGIAEELGVPCVAFSVIGAFPMLAMRHIQDIGIGDDDDDVQVPGFPVVPAPIRIPRAELPEFLRRRPGEFSESKSSRPLQAGSFGLAINTSSAIEKEYCEIYMREGYVKRAYFLGPVALAPPPPPPIPLPTSAAAGATSGNCYIMDWLDSKPNNSVVYISFGTTAHVKDAQLDELALGLETSGKSFLWVVRGKEEWSPPEGWEERVSSSRGLIIRAWAPQTAILGHRAVAAFVTQCGWNSILETVAAGVPVLTWPLLFEQFITERLVTQVLGIGERLWPHGAGLRSETYEEHEVVPAQDVARALTAFMLPGGSGDAARIKVKDLAAKTHAAVAPPGGSSHRDLHRLIDDLLLVAMAPNTPTTTT